MTTVAQLEAPSVTVEAGSHVTVPLNVRNLGQLVEDYRLEVVGVPARWATIEPATFTLYPGTSQVVNLDLHPPRSSDVPAGSLPFGVQVVPSEHPDDAVVPEGAVEVLPFLDTTAELVPRTSHGAGRGSHQLAVDNRGNVPVTALVLAVPGSDKLRAEAGAGSVVVPPGQATFVDITARPASRIWRGKAVTHAFTVQVDPQDSSQVTLSGSYVQDPTLPPWFVKALVAALAVLLALTLAWLLLLKPAIRSAAEAAVAEPVKSAAADAASAQTAAQGAKTDQKAASTAAAQAQKAVTSASATAPVEPPKTVTAPFSSRLAATTPPAATETATYTVPAGQSLGLTDFVLENSQGDTGVLSIKLDNQVLFTQALESFRTTDYHFVTPFVAPAGGRLVLSVTCNKVGAPLGMVPAPTRCVNAVTFGGPLTKERAPDSPAASAPTPSGTPTPSTPTTTSTPTSTATG